MGPLIDCSGFTYATTSTGDYIPNSLTVDPTNYGWKLDNDSNYVWTYEYDNGRIIAKRNIERKKEKKLTNFVPKKIIYHDPATIVFWDDGTKTIVKCSPGETYNKYHGFCAALAKKLLGNNSKVNRVVKSGIEQE